MCNQNYTLDMFISFKMAYSYCFSLGGNLDFIDFLQKSFITSTTVRFLVQCLKYKQYWQKIAVLLPTKSLESLFDLGLVS